MMSQSVPFYAISLAKKFRQFLHHLAIVGGTISGDTKELRMDIEFVEYSVNMSGEVKSGVAGGNMTETKQVLVINKVFIDIMTSNGYSLATR